MPSLSVKSIVNLISAGTKSVDRAIQSSRRGSKIRPKTKLGFCDSKIKPGKVSVPLPDEIWNKICDNLSPLDQIKLRRVNKQLYGVVEKRLETSIYLDVVKCDMDDVLINDDSDNDFHKHRRHNVLVHMSERNVALIVDDRWTSRDVYCIYGAIQFFAKYAKSVTIDVQIAELIVVGLSTMKLSRWHSFECYVNAVGPIVGDELHMKLSKPPPSRPVLFGNATEITIRALISDLAHLSRIADYAVPATALFSPEALELFRVNIVDNRSQCRSELGASVRYLKRPHKHLNVFKKWINTNELREKYVQQYS